MKPISFSVLGVGAWGLNARNWEDLRTLLVGGELADDGSKGPKPAVIPANERRRAPLPVRLAVEASSQACDAADVDPAEVACVFVSGLGDTALTDYMCKVLASDNKALSPTKFHNSVHNAAAGYWTISTGCMQAANSVAGFNESVSLTLLEALTQAEVEQRALLLTFYDAPASAVLKPLLKNDTSFATSIVIAPTAIADPSASRFSASVSQASVDWPAGNWRGELQACYETNPVARILPFLQLLMSGEHDTLAMPLSGQTALRVEKLS
ncbi:beta-ketoacyl synthase chain length factor [Arenicella xantha]|uniref:Beta-ketoacyl synthase-like protein n=1 Tax=Arenicella xantha TaxID=644221 RepID=A0A395JQC1_9GAMM|nr:beta-ketoacyl synthase chain length factor [Arenicella xantha]RBP53727.1 beta-ketoacyl synthase-like protein [Arenicella xantha]